MASKNKFGNFWVLGCMTDNTQHLDICRICSQSRGDTMRLRMVSLQIFCVSAVFAMSALCNDLRNGFSACVRSFAGSIIPFGVICFSHIFSAHGGHAFNGTVFSSASPSFANLKLLAAFFARTLQNSFLFTRANFLGAFFGTSMRCSSNVRIRSGKQIFTCFASKRSMPSANNCSLEFAHG